MYYPDQPFHIRTYKKSELAHLYNPNVCLKVALQILRRWIVYNLPLLQELEQEGYRARNRLLSPRQVATIIRYLGLTNFHTKGEPREAIVAVSMLQNDNWILPINNGGDIAYKPPFFHWCIAALSLPA